MKNLKGEDFNFELPIEEAVLSKLDSENFDENEEDEDSLWSEGSYIKPIDKNDPDFEEKRKYFDETNDMEKNFNCKKCNKAIGKHNLYWHEGMCDDCFFDE